MKNIYIVRTHFFIAVCLFLHCPVTRADDIRNVNETRPGVFKAMGATPFRHTNFERRSFYDLIVDGEISHFSSYGSADACEQARETATSLALMACSEKYSNCGITQELKTESRDVCLYTVFAQRNTARRRTSLNEDKQPAVNPRSSNGCDPDRDPACAPYASDAS